MKNPSHKFVNALVDASHESSTLGDPVVGDLVETDDGKEGIVLEIIEHEYRLKYEDGTEEVINEKKSYLAIIDRASIKNIWEEHLKDEMPDGVGFQDGIEESLKIKLVAGVTKLLKGKPDYHPGSEKNVRDLVHPSLFVHVNKDYSEEKTTNTDRWGRPFESSKYQWLPTTFEIDNVGHTKINGEINNLDRHENHEMYNALSNLFTTFLPLFEDVYGYTQTTSFHIDQALDAEANLPEKAPITEDVKPISLRGRRLQVITKIVEYKLEGEEILEGVWHVEGMSHEHILATGVCILSRNENVEGATLRFKRSYTEDEAGHLFWNVDQIRPWSLNEIVDEGLIPIGSIDTPANRLLVFPNCHIHKLSKMNLRGGKGVGKRQVIVFWLVDPEHVITDMADVEKPQDAMTFDEACALRLELMKERRLHKQTHNVRSVSLCEH